MEDDDFVLIQKILQGDQDAYAPLVRKYQSRILQLCGAMLTPTEAEDAAQEVFVKAYHALARFKGDSSFYTWIYRIASNHCLDLGRKKSRSRTESWDALIEKEGDRIQELLASPDRDIENRDDAELVQKILSFLPDTSRLVLVLREMQGLSYEEMATQLNCSLDAIKGRLKRARQEFKEKLRHFIKSEPV